MWSMMPARLVVSCKKNVVNYWDNVVKRMSQTTHDWEWFIWPIYGDDWGINYTLFYPYSMSFSQNWVQKRIRTLWLISFPRCSPSKTRAHRPPSPFGPPASSKEGLSNFELWPCVSNANLHHVVMKPSFLGGFRNCSTFMDTPWTDLVKVLNHPFFVVVKDLELALKVRSNRSRFNPFSSVSMSIVRTTIVSSVVNTPQSRWFCTLVLPVETSFSGLLKQDGPHRSGRLVV